MSVIALSLYAGCVSERYPEHLMEFAPNYDGDIPESWQRFFDLREQLLLDYGYNTARAYWADLQDWFEWAIGRNKNVLALTEKDQTQYYALLRRRKYSEATIRRRRTAYRLMKMCESSGSERA